MRQVDVIREHFERVVKDTQKLASNTPLGVLEINGKFARYMDPDTDTLFIGFALGMRCEERIREHTSIK